MRSRRSVPRASLVPLVVLALVASSCGRLQPLSTQQATERLNIATTKLFAADGSLIANLHGEINREIVPLDRIPEHVQNAVVSIEDERFWNHRGIDLRSISRAAVRNVSNGAAGGESGRIEGGSTITQQLVKALYFAFDPKAGGVAGGTRTPERAMSRKVEEARITWQFEQRYEKQQILEMYVNTIYFGRATYGVQTAARSYFHKNTAELSLAEAAYLAGVIHEPGRYEIEPDDPPEKQQARRDRGIARRNLVLQKMVDLGYASPEEADAAGAEPIELFGKEQSRWTHPYFVDMVLTQLGVLRCTPARLDPRFNDLLGDSCQERAKNLYRGGLRIYTTVDPKAQSAAEDAVREVLPDNVDKVFASLAAVEPQTGYIRAVVGGRNYYPDGCDTQDSIECKWAKVNLALGRAGGGLGRQPGSSFKPFVLATALEKGVGLQTSFSGAPYTYRGPCGGSGWSPGNYEGSSGGGSLIESTVKSVNRVFARLLVDGIGDGNGCRGATMVAGVARRLGIKFPTRDEMRAACGENYGKGGCIPADDVPAVSLGAKEVSPLEMASAYGVFAAEGNRVDPTAIVRITDAEGRTLYEAKPPQERVLPRGVALAITSVLEQVIERGTGTKARLDRPAAGKTGTAQQWRDAWFAGYVPQLSAAVWVGNPARQEEMTPRNGYPIRVTGGSYPAQVWEHFMRKALEGVPVEKFPPPPSQFFGAVEGTPPPDVLVPSVVGMSLTEAGAVLRDAGLAVGESLCLSREVAEGTVVRQSPMPGRTAPGGSTVTICVAVHSLPEPEDNRPDDEENAGTPVSQAGTVPNVVGESRARAQANLSEAGFEMASVRECDPSDASEAGRVWKQDPSGGTSAPTGTTVTVWYNGASC